MHRVITDAPPKTHVDHIEHKLHTSLDNRKINLRVSTPSQNTRNKKGKNKNNQSGHRNVSWSKARDCWIVHLQVKGKNTFMRAFDDLEYGEFAGLP